MHEILKNLVERLHAAAQGNLESVILYGSAARGDFREGRSDLNVMCTMHSLALSEMIKLEETVKWWTGTHKQPAPLLFTTEELHSSADVFSIELLDIQQNHQVLYGKDSVAGIAVPMNLHRVQVEHDLRLLLLRLRQHFLHSGENYEALAAILAKSFSSATTLLRHTLISLEEQVPSSSLDLFARIAKLTGADAAAFEAVHHLRESGTAPGEIVPLYGAYLTALEKVIVAMDQHLPKRHWQRTDQAHA
jgi:predicted nucleotidyltransferase